MPLTRLMMLFALVLLPIGLVYGMSTLNGGDPKKAMFTELACLGAGAVIFYTAWSIEKKKGS